MFVPESIPTIPIEVLRSWKSLSFEDICAEIIFLFVGDEIDLASCRKMTHAAFAMFNNENGSSTEPPLPLHHFGDLYLLDCSLGPTFAFKDIGQQVVGQLLNHVLEKQGNKRAIIAVDTSGDTGPAAIAAVKRCPLVDIVCLYPHERVSRVQELQMITVHEDNVFVYRTEGTSDEQASVLKEVFQDAAFAAQHNLCSINSINWARIMVQSTYYVWSYLQVCKEEADCGVQQVNFCIPTGAFGNALGAFVARQMGIPIGKILCATNANDIVYRTLTTGDMSMGDNVQTCTPAMDIQFAYNLERMVYYMSGEDPQVVRDVMACVDRQFRYEEGTRGAQLSAEVLRRIQQVFAAVVVTDDETLGCLRDFEEKFGFTLCPHSAVGVHAALTTFAPLVREGGGATPMICVLTAHPAKVRTGAGSVAQRLRTTADIMYHFLPAIFLSYLSSLTPRPSHIHS
jgi:threonine synthase